MFDLLLQLSIESIIWSLLPGPDFLRLTRSIMAQSPQDLKVAILGAGTSHYITHLVSIGLCKLTTL